jgi:GntR family histidine utilization transcriptional repressor
MAALLRIEPAAPAFHVLCVHHEDEAPIQIEDRWVAPALVPDFLAQDFTVVTPTDYLKAALPATEVEHTVEAIRPDAETMRLLRIAPDQPCLRLTRTTWNHDRPVTHARMTHPGDRFSLSGRFRPEA